MLLEWVNSASKDVAFYNIYRKRQNDSLFTSIYTLQGKEEDIPTQYTDEEINPGSTYLYYMQATDNSGLTSEPSKTKLVKAPGTNSENIKLKKREYAGTVKLLFVTKTDKEIEKYLIYRSTDNEPLRLYGNSNLAEFTDSKLAYRKTYIYQYRAVYADGSKSALSNPVKVKN